MMVLHMYLVKSKGNDDVDETQGNVRRLRHHLSEINFRSLFMRSPSTTMKILFVMIFLGILVLVQPYRLFFIEPGRVAVKFTKRALVNSEKEIIVCKESMVYNRITSGIFSYPTSTRTMRSGSFRCPLKNGSMLQIDSVRLSYKVIPHKADILYAAFENNLQHIEETFIRTCLQETFVSVSGKHTADSISDFEPTCQSVLRRNLADKGLEMEILTFLVTVNNSSTDNGAGVNKRSAAWTGREILEAARLDAEAKKIKAIAEAEYNRIIGASLSPLLIQKQWIEKWDGKLYPGQSINNIIPNHQK